MEWFRFYHEALNDPKVQRLDGELFKTWVNILCLASAQSDRGTLPTSLEDIAWALRVPEVTLQERFTLLQQYGFIDFDSENKSFKIHGWGNRQKPSDDVTARVQRHRSKRKGDETLQQRSGNALEKKREEKRREDREIDPRASARGVSHSQKKSSSSPNPRGATNGRNAKLTLVDVYGDLAQQARNLGEEPNQRGLPPERA